MKTFAPRLFILAVLSLLAPTFAHATLVKPDSAEGRQLIHRMAEDVSNVFVNQSAVLQGNSEAEIDVEKLFTACEASKTTLLAELETLELNGSNDLLSAKAALQKIACPAKATETEDGPSAALPALRAAHDHFFTATVYLRSSDIFN